MPDYNFHLHGDDPAPPAIETVAAADDQEARDLAEMRLLLGRGFSKIVVDRQGMEPIHIQRDRKPGGARRAVPPWPR